MSHDNPRPRHGPEADTAPEPASRWHAEVDGHPVTFWITVATAIAAVTLGFGVWWTYGLDQAGEMAAPTTEQPTSGAPMGDGDPTGPSMSSMSPDAPRVPPVFGYYDGEPIAFIHTEVSDPTIAQTLEGMMASPVPVVESLATIPAPALGTVYVFTNGLVPDDTPAGPLGFQPDVFDSAPGDETYSPLREIVEATWNDQQQARLLTTAEQTETAAADGNLKLQQTGIVVNAPLLTWPTGQR